MRLTITFFLIFCNVMMSSSFSLRDMVRVRPRNPFNPTTQVSRNKSAIQRSNRMPKYMIMLYNRLTSPGNGRKGIPYAANTVRGLQSVTQIISNSTMRIKFNLTLMKNGINITRDEIHLYMAPPNKDDKKLFKPFILSFSDIASRQLVRRFIIPAFHQGWQVLSMNKWTNRWVKDHTVNKGLLLNIYRGNQKATNNPFVNFSSNDSPYMILYASERASTLLAWRFLIEQSLQSVAQHTKHRHIRNVGSSNSVNASFQNSSSQNRNAQCIPVERNLKLKNVPVKPGLLIVQPEKFKMTKCSNICVPVTHYAGRNNQTNIHITNSKRCCNASTFHDLMVLLQNPKSGEMEVQLLNNFVPTGCQWLIQ